MNLHCKNGQDEYNEFWTHKRACHSPVKCGLDKYDKGILRAAKTYLLISVVSMKQNLIMCWQLTS